MNVIGYTRVSTDEQAAEGLSLDVQRKRLEAYCQAREWTLMAVFEDAGVSGRTLERSGLEEALRFLERPIVDVLLALKLDRLTRSVVDLYNLVERCEAAGVRLAAVQDALDTGTANGRMVTSILAVLAQWEREIISERTSAALQHKKANGEHVGLVPYGFQLGPEGKLEANTDELTLIQRMKRMRRRGMSYRAIAGKLNADGVESRRRSWSHEGIRGLLSDHLNARKAKYLNGSNGKGVS